MPTTKKLATKPRRLTDIAKKIRSHVHQGKRSAMVAARHQRDIGKLLIEAKSQLPHGRFLKWATKQFGWTPQHIGRLMRIAKGWDEFRPQIEQGYSIWPQLTSGKVSTAASTRSSHRQPDALPSLQKLFEANQHFRARFTPSAVVDAAKQVKAGVADEQRWWTRLLEAVEGGPDMTRNHRPVPVPKPVATPRPVN